MTRKFVGFFLAAGLLCTASAQADPVTDWNAIAVTASNARPGPPGLMDLAVVHAAMHDAVQAIQRRFQPFHYAGTGAGSPAAAAVAAAHRALVLIYPLQQGALDLQYEAYKLSHGLSGDPGLAVGEAAAAALYAAHYREVNTPPSYFGTDGIGEWRTTSTATPPLPMAFLQLAFETPFTLNRIDQFRPPPPPPIGSVAYAREYDEAKKLGAAFAPVDVRTPAMTDLAWFWSANFGAQWNETARQLADGHLTDVGDSARLFALLNLAAADAAMAVWESKYFYNFWRPITAIHEIADDGNRRTVPDVGWAPLISLASGGATPLYPDYVSGANGLTGAFTGMLREFFNTDTMAFTVKTTAPLALVKTRPYTSFSQAAQEVVDARILLGIHFRSADEEARRLGERVAHWTFQKFLRPVPGSQQ
jgi:hypothetical protein